MMVLRLTEFATNKQHTFRIKKSTSIQWYLEGDHIRVTDYYTGKTIKNINVAKFGCCNIECSEEI